MPDSPEAITSVVSFLLQLGLPGVVILALGFAYYRKDLRVEALQDTLIKMAQENAKAMSDTANAVSSLRDLLLQRSKAE